MNEVVAMWQETMPMQKEGLMARSSIGSERRPDKSEVDGSIPFGPTKIG